MTGIPALSLFGYELRSERAIFYLIWLIALAALWATHNLLDSRPGRAIRALRGGFEMAEAFGVDGARLKIVVFVYAALLACVSGWLYAHLQRFVNPTPFSITAGIEYLFMAVVGGAGSVWGAVGRRDADHAVEAGAAGHPAAAARPLGQLRDDRVRRAADRDPAARARRRVAVDRAPAAARAAVAGQGGRAAARCATTRRRTGRCSRSWRRARRSAGSSRSTT
jgi:hypothetical protein